MRYLNLRSRSHFIYRYVHSSVLAQKTNALALAKFICVLFANGFLEAVKGVRPTFINPEVLIELDFFTGLHIRRIVVGSWHAILLKFVTRHLVAHFLSVFVVAGLLHVAGLVALS